MRSQLAERRPILWRRSLAWGLCLATSWPSAQAGGNQQVANFAIAKQLARQIWSEHPITLYSGCGYRPDNAQLDGGCAFVARAPQGRGGRIEWEHVVPAAAFGRGFASWTQGHPQCVDSHGKAYVGRRCAQRHSADFRRIEADLYNLVPEIGEINNMRGNLPMGQVQATAAVGTFSALAGLPTALISRQLFEPPPQVQGDVARITLYMDAAYPSLGLLSDDQRLLMHAWSRQDPTDAWECRRAEAIFAVQGNLNSFVAATCAPMPAQAVAASRFSH